MHSQKPSTMTSAPRKYPIGIQNFEDLITSGCVYVDKSDLVYELVNSARVAFLSRPRRFGKSLLVSTLKAYFEGKKELFKGLTIEQLENKWQKYPVLHIDFSQSKFTNEQQFKDEVHDMLSRWEEQYGKRETTKSFGKRFAEIISRAAQQAEGDAKAVILIDEYDAPLLDVLNNEKERAAIRQVLRDLFSPLKGQGENISFLFLTGITKFSQLSIFSELNHLLNISMLPQYAAICGITEEELFSNFKEDIALLADENGESYEEATAHLKYHYDGYHFSEKSPDMYNPYSLLQVLMTKKYDNYWFSSGTPTFLLDLLQNKSINIDELENRELKSTQFNAPITDALELIPTFYHSGYLTIKSYHQRHGIYTLGTPNEEVRVGLVESLLPRLLPKILSDSNLDIYNFVKDLEKGDIESFLKRLQVFFANIPYDLNNKSEKHYQTIFYIFTTLIGQYVEAEHRTATGRIDMLIRTPDNLYLFELKLNYTAQDALDQINQKRYYTPFELGNQKVIKVGVNFDDTTRTIRDWLVE